MVSLPSVFVSRKQATSADVDVSDMDLQTLDEPVPGVHNLPPQPLSPSFDPVRKAMMSRIALVSIEENADLPALLNDGSLQSRLVQRIMLPRNPRIAGDELYELEGMDMIVVLSEEPKRISKDMLRWLRLLKQLGVPMVVLLPYQPTKRREQEKLMQFSQHVGLPVVPFTAENLLQARQDFVMTTMRLSPATGLALAAQMPHFRSPLMRNLLDAAVHDSLSADADVTVLQMQFVHQICAAYGQNGQQFETQRIALETLVKMTQHYTKRFAARLPIRNPQRRTRFTNALSTLFLGYAVTGYLGETPPSFRKQLLPQIWRLYRASGKPVHES